MPEAPIILTSPEPSGDVYPEIAEQQLVNDIYNDLVYVFDDTGEKDEYDARLRVPGDYQSGGKVVIRWWTPATSGTVHWAIPQVFLAAGESADPSAFDSTDTASVAVPATARQIVDTEITLSAAIAAGDAAKLKIQRDGTQAGEPAAVVVVDDIWFEFT